MLTLREICDQANLNWFQVFLQLKLRSGSLRVQEFLSKPRPAEYLELE